MEHLISFSMLKAWLSWKIKSNVADVFTHLATSLTWEWLRTLLSCESSPVKLIGIECIFLKEGRGVHLFSFRMEYFCPFEGKYVVLVYKDVVIFFYYYINKIYPTARPQKLHETRILVYRRSWRITYRSKEKWLWNAYCN